MHSTEDTDRANPTRTAIGRRGMQEGSQNHKKSHRRGDMNASKDVTGRRCGKSPLPA
ncbi:msr5194 [Mesorhizobium japonicum MAFF 303099]|uniref:Msr5194 protein n=1 Tax=Mesorhizobium japonicum (strain LMG 29417 / CECT 9101 / MAFF 303099) TaxID=266835 RepID=Q98CD6_RHILO|nr:msr5194 [Mesorhizobium japonicum MAFF 303099]